MRVGCLVSAESTDDLAVGFGVADDAANVLAVQHVLVALVDLLQLVLAGHHVIEVQLADLVSEAKLGLIKAALKYDAGHESHATFKTFATRYIRGAVLDYLRGLDLYPKATRKKIKLGQVREVPAINYHDFRSFTDAKNDCFAEVENRDEAEELLRSLTPLEEKILRQRYLEDVRVTEICPGRVETDIFARVQKIDAEEARRRFFDDYECPKPGDVADAVAFAIAAPHYVNIGMIEMMPTLQVPGGLRTGTRTEFPSTR